MVACLVRVAARRSACFARTPLVRASTETISFSARGFSMVERVPGAAQQEEKTTAQWTVGDAQSTSKKCDPYEQGGKYLSREQAEANRAQVPHWQLDEAARSLSRECAPLPDLVVPLYARVVLAKGASEAGFHLSLRGSGQTCRWPARDIVSATAFLQRVVGARGYQ